MICTAYDQWLADQDKTIWRVEIEHYGSDQSVWETIYQDDGRPGTTESAWLRLKQYLLNGSDYNNHCSPVKFGISFRDHIEWLPIEDDNYSDHIEGIYFSKGAIADMLSPHTSNCYVLGWIKDGVLTKVWYRIPEVIEYQREEVRSFDPESAAIIWCK